MQGDSGASKSSLIRAGPSPPRPTPGQTAAATHLRQRLPRGLAKPPGATARPGRSARIGAQLRRQPGVETSSAPWAVDSSAWLGVERRAARASDGHFGLLYSRVSKVVQGAATCGKKERRTTCPPYLT